MTLTEMLEGRHTLELEWWEPWPAAGPEGNELDAHVRSTATVHHCVNMQRRAVADATARNPHAFSDLPPAPGDADLLGDFISTHWAQPVSPPQPASPWEKLRDLLAEHRITIAAHGGSHLWIGIGDEDLKVADIRDGWCPELDAKLSLPSTRETPDHEGGSLL